MRKIIVWIMATLDGYISGTGPEGDPANMDWIFPGVQEAQPHADELFERCDTLLMGRVTYEGLSQYWPTQTGGFADKVNKISKIVFSTSLKPDQVKWGEWPTISLIYQNTVEEMVKIKRREGKDMLITGSARLVQGFTNAGLVDEYHIVVHPMILGSGKRLFDSIQARHALKLADTKRYDGGAILLQYEVK